MGYFNFNGHSSNEFGLCVSKKNIYSSSERDVAFNSIPGRSGDVIIDNNCYKNLSVSYTVGIKDLSKIAEIKTWLYQPGYMKLFDSYIPGYYRKACYSSALDVEELFQNVGSADIVFNCKPFKYSNLGESSITITNSTTITNPEAFDSYPLIRIYGSGDVTLMINNRSYLVSGISTYVDIDSELMSCYKGTVLKNNTIGFTEFPVLKNGANSIAFTGTVSKIVITPRWMTL